jgi:hypothetical protein
VKLNFSFRPVRFGVKPQIKTYDENPEPHDGQRGVPGLVNKHAVALLQAAPPLSNLNSGGML